MILTMAYLVVIAVLLGSAAAFGERLCAELRWPRRSVWLAAMLASVALPAYAIFFGAATTNGTAILSLPQLPDFVPAFNAEPIEPAGNGTAITPSFIWPDWQAFNSGLVALWIVSSIALLIFCGLSGLRLRRVILQSQTIVIGDQEVLLSNSLGPAVLGLLRPRIVMPKWLAEQETALRSLVLNHEREHIAARDQLSVFAALLMVALMPWNIALWWQLRRLRAAIEVDCDSRILREGANAHEYSEALLTVGKRSLRAPFASVALTEPVSELENRIRIMLAKARALSVIGFGVRSVLVVSMLGLTLAVNAPNAQQPADGGVQAGTNRPGSTVRTEIYAQLSAAQACLEEDDPACSIEILDGVRDGPELNAYETAQLYNFYAFVHFQMDEPEQAENDYETILALPQSELPDGLISSVTRNLATLYLQRERYQDGLELFERWMELPSVTADADDYYLIATVLYQMEQYDNALKPLERAIAEAPEPVEQFYQLLYVLNFQTGNQEGVLDALEILNDRWPGEVWQKALENAQQQASSTEAPAIPGNPLRPADTNQPLASSEYLPIFRAAPIYPQLAAARGLEGNVVVSFTVSTTGSTKDIEIVESSDSIFDNASIESVQKYKYEPRLVDGTPVEVEGVTARIVFELADNND